MKDKFRNHNIDQLKQLIPFVGVISLFMVLVAIWIEDSHEMMIINGLLVITMLIAFVGIRILTKIKNKNKKIFEDIFIHWSVFSIFFWGASMLGFNPNSPIAFFDFTISIIMTGVVLIVEWKRLVLMHGIILGYLFFLTPFFRNAEENQSLLIASILLFVLLGNYLSHLVYKKTTQNYQLAQHLMDQQKNLESLVIEKTEQLIQSESALSTEVIRVFSNVLGYYDAYTKGHSENVAIIAEQIAKAMGYDLAFQKKIYWAGMIHDIGKIRIPKDILNKSTKLTAEEYECIKEHPKHGYDMIKDSLILSSIATDVLHHHEHYDGTGYPSGLTREQIPMASQILNIADAWDAMRSKRIYRNELSIEVSRLEIEHNSGKQFAPDVVTVFLEMLKTNDYGNSK